MTALDPIAADAEGAGGSQSDGIGMMPAARPLGSNGITAHRKIRISHGAPHADRFGRLHGGTSPTNKAMRAG